MELPFSLMGSIKERGRPPEGAPPWPLPMLEKVIPCMEHFKGGAGSSGRISIMAKRKADAWCCSGIYVIPGSRGWGR